MNAETGNRYEPGSKTTLLIPGRARFGEKVVTPDLHRFLAGIAASPELPAEYSIRSEVDRIDLTLEYDPKQPFASGSYPDYRVVYTIDQSTLYSALTKKAEQLGGTGFGGLQGILVCDGESGLLAPHRLRSGGAFNADDVIKHFLAHHPGIAFVLTFGVGGKNRSVLEQEVIYSLLVTEYALAETVRGWLQPLTERLRNALPKPQTDAVNAKSWLVHHPRVGRPHGKWNRHMSRDSDEVEVKISARVVLELLAGTLRQEDFFANYGFVATPGRPQLSPNPFENWLQRGKVIRAAELVESEDADDDFLRLTLAGPDAAISPFRVPDEPPDSPEGE